MSQTPSTTLPNQGRTLQVLHDSLRVLASGDHTDLAYEVFDVTSPISSGPPPHAHPWAESFYILDGEVEIIVEQQTTIAKSGDFLQIPSNTIHTYRTISPTARFLVMTSTNKASAFFTDLSQEIDINALDFDKVMAVAHRHRVVAAA